MPRFPREGSETLIIAHRGYPFRGPENSIVAFQDALDAGASGIELDVWRCCSGELLVTHDCRVGDLGVVQELTLDEIVAAGGKVPTLGAVLSVMPPTVVNIEIKSPRSRQWRFDAGQVVDGLRAEVEPYSTKHEFVFSSFNRELASQLANLRPVGRCALLVHRRSSVRRAARYSVSNGIHSLHLHRKRVSRRTLKLLRRAGLSFSVWTVDEPRELKRMLTSGAELLITNTVPLAVSLRFDKDR